MTASPIPEPVPPPRDGSSSRLLAALLTERFGPRHGDRMGDDDHEPSGPQYVPLYLCDDCWKPVVWDDYQQKWIHL